MVERIAFFDVDGVLSKHTSCWGVAHAYFGVSDRALQNMKEYKEGNINFPEWMRRDIGLWKGKRPNGLKIKEIERIFAYPKIVPGADDLLGYLRQSGYHIALVTLGFSAATYPISDRLEVPRRDVYTNHFELDKYYNLTGRAYARVFPHAKSDVARRLCEDLRVSPRDCVAVTDTNWDRDLLEFVGTSIAFNPTPADEIRTVTKHVVEEKNLRKVIKILETLKAES